MLSSIVFSLTSIFCVLGTNIPLDKDSQGTEYVPFDGEIKPVIKSPEPYTYLSENDLPTAWDWRNVNGTNYCGKVLNQKNPNVCGSW